MLMLVKFLEKKDLKSSEKLLKNIKHLIQYN